MMMIMMMMMMMMIIFFFCYNNNNNNNNNINDNLDQMCTQYCMCQGGTGNNQRRTLQKLLSFIQETLEHIDENQMNVEILESKYDDETNDDGETSFSPDEETIETPSKK
jgi:hypothetical protein